jgi:hypothetical protein
MACLISGRTDLREPFTISAEVRTTAFWNPVATPPPQLLHRRLLSRPGQNPRSIGGRRHRMFSISLRTHARYDSSTAREESVRMDASDNSDKIRNVVSIPEKLIPAKPEVVAPPSKGQNPAAFAPRSRSPTRSEWVRMRQGCVFGGRWRARRATCAGSSASASARVTTRVHPRLTTRPLYVRTFEPI